MISENIRFLKKRIETAARESGHHADDIRLVAASKYATADQIKEAYHQNITDFGENRLQDGEQKSAFLKDLDIRWHFIGRIQMNKVRRIFERFQLIQSVDRVDVLHKANQSLSDSKKKRDVFLQVNISGEATKAGFSFDEIMKFFNNEQQRDFSRIRICGLMGIGPHTSQSKVIRETFLSFKKLFDTVRNKCQDIQTLSNGMSHDFEEAIRCGSNMIRVGSLIFKEG